MTTTSYRAKLAATIESALIHAAVCRYRRQQLVCSTCTELSERAERAVARLAAEIAASNAGASPDYVGPLQVAA
jgi:hypothetical protein